MREVTTYMDAYNRPTRLTDAQIEWFHEVVAACKTATGCDVEIVAFDHDQYIGKSKDALGCCCTDNPDDPIHGETYITIDCFFIAEKYAERFEGGFDLSFSSLEEVVAHELAHLYVWRHGKKHDKKTAEFLNMIQAA